MISTSSTGAEGSSVGRFTTTPPLPPRPHDSAKAAHNDHHSSAAAHTSTIHERHIIHHQVDTTFPSGFQSHSARRFYSSAIPLPVLFNLRVVPFQYLRILLFKHVQEHSVTFLGGIFQSAYISAVGVYICILGRGRCIGYIGLGDFMFAREGRG